LFIKVCGITNAEDASAAVKAGVNALGFIFYQGSERYITPEAASEIVLKLPDHVSKVGVFVHEEKKEILRIARKVPLSAVQLLGPEGPDDLFGYDMSIIKVFRVKPDFDVEVMKNYVVDAFLLDTHRQGAMGGTGESFDWNIALKARQYGRIIVSGGLTPDNVDDAVRFVRPYGVDVSSGIESRPGKKDHDRMRNFIARARNAHSSLDE